MTQIMIEGLMLGLSSGIYCVGSCLIFFMPYLLAEGKQKVSENLGKISLFMLGRFLAYVAFAIVMGFIGQRYRNIFTARFSHICLIIASVLMLIYSLGHNSKASGACAGFVSRFKLLQLPFFLGLFTGLNPCPPFMVSAARLWTLNNILVGVILFIAFFIGTSLYMIPLALVSYVNRGERVKRIGLMVAMISGIWFLIVGVSGLLR